MVLDAAQGHRGADAQAVRGLPPARRADRHLRQQARPRGARPVRPARRDRADARARRRPRRAGRSAWGATSSAPTICSPTRCCCSSAARTTGCTEPIRCTRPRRPEARRAAARERRSRKLREEVEMVARAVPAVRPRGLSRGPSDAGLLRQRAQQFRRARAARTASADWRRRRARSRRATARRSRPTSRKVSGFVFKVQANIDPQHRDRIAFVRLVLGPLPARHEAEERAHRRGSCRCRTRCSSWRASATSPRRPGPATSSASPTTARCGSATR